MPMAFASRVVRSGDAVTTARSPLRFDVERSAAMMLRVVVSTSSLRPACAGTTRTMFSEPIAKRASFGACSTRLRRFAKNRLACGPSSRRSVSPFLGSASNLEIFRWLRCQPPGP